jgi:lysyl-tRNA synthetase class 2
LPAENRLLEAMEAGLPACSGVALGVDRLAMLLLSGKRLENVIPFVFKNA